MISINNDLSQFIRFQYLVHMVADKPVQTPSLARASITRIHKVGMHACLKNDYAYAITTNISGLAHLSILDDLVCYCLQKLQL